jgi:hypothetical protein
MFTGDSEEVGEGKTLVSETQWELALWGTSDGRVDQAGWHSSKELVIPENVVLLPLPSYSV